MDEQRLEEIEKITEELIEKTRDDNQQLAPSKHVATVLENLLKHFRIKLQFTRFENPDISGAYDKENKTIYISTADPPRRQAFTVAHELGHYVLHKRKKDDIFFRSQMYTFNGDQEKYEEKEANWFAASLLMPRELIKKVWKKERDIDLTAANFGVSKPAAYWRLKNLGII